YCGRWLLWAHEPLSLCACPCSFLDVQQARRQFDADGNCSGASAQRRLFQREIELRLDACEIGFDLVERRRAIVDVVEPSAQQIERRLLRVTRRRGELRRGDLALERVDLFLQLALVGARRDDEIALRDEESQKEKRQLLQRLAIAVDEEILVRRGLAIQRLQSLALVFDLLVALPRRAADVRQQPVARFFRVVAQLTHALLVDPLLKSGIRRHREEIKELPRGSHSPDRGIEPSRDEARDYRERVPRNAEQRNVRSREEGVPEIAHVRLRPMAAALMADGGWQLR